MTGRVLSSILTALFIAAFILAAVIFAGFIFPENRVVSPRIDPGVSGQPPIPMIYSYLFQDGRVTISIMVNGSVYNAAKTADKSVTVFGNISENIWITDSYRAMVDDPAQETMYHDLITHFRKIRDELGLDADEYLELMAVYVQSMKYETLEENPAKFPIEVVVDQAGDCDDKSLLLAGLLSREGYSVALLSFSPENHMALGIGSDDYRYQNTNYTFLETTNVSFVGVVTEKLGNDVSLHSSPIIIPIGTGTRGYTRGAETRYIHDMIMKTEQEATELEPQLQAMQEELKTDQQHIVDLESRMQHLINSGNVREYNTLVSPHNALVSDYNDSLHSYQRLFARYEKYVIIHNYIIDHEFDRKGVFEHVKTNMPE